jgi:hypothetical protein
MAPNRSSTRFAVSRQRSFGFARSVASVRQVPPSVVRRRPGCYTRCYTILSDTLCLRLERWLRRSARTFATDCDHLYPVDGEQGDYQRRDRARKQVCPKRFEAAPDRCARGAQIGYSRPLAGWLSQLPRTITHTGGQ